jgi:hypothetical protein
MEDKSKIDIEFEEVKILDDLNNQDQDVPDSNT